MIIMRKKKGFTVIEAMVALVLIMMSVVAAFFVVQTSLFLSTSSKNSITARFLAQEAMEYVHHVRETQLSLHDGGANNVQWLSGFEPCGRNNPCTIDVSDPVDVEIQECSGGVCSVLGYCTRDNSGGANDGRRQSRYGYDSNDAWSDWIDTQFTRSIIFREVDENGRIIIGNGVGNWRQVQEIVATVVIEWQERGEQKKIVYEQNFFNFVDR